MSASRPRHIALQFGRIKHFNEGLSEVSRQLACQLAIQASALKRERGWHFHFIMEEKWHGMFGANVQYHALTEDMRGAHRFPQDLDVWHCLHQHMRYRAPRNTNKKLITVHDLNHVYTKQGWSLWWQNVRITHHLRQADQLIAISQFVADDIHKHLPWAPPAQVIHNGVADLVSRPRQNIEELEGQAFLLHISRMSPTKNVEALIAMAAVWPEKLLVLVGPFGEDVEKHQRQVHDMALKNIRFILDVNEAQKAWLYAHCEAFVFPSLLEGFGLPPIEAMHFGKPVIVASSSSLPEICGQGASYIDDFSPVAIREKVIEAVQGHCPNRTLAQARQYDWRIAATRYIDLYAASTP